MTLQPTREEWLAARERFARNLPPNVYSAEVDRATEAALGPCPPEPAPRFHVEVCAFDVGAGWTPRNLTVEATDGGRIAVGLSSERLFMDLDAAGQLATWLHHCAQWLRDQAAKP